MKLSVPNGINMDAHVGWCPGCGHGIVARLVAEAARDLGIEENIIMVEDVACGEFAQNVLKFNTIGAAHGHGCRRQAHPPRRDRHRAPGRRFRLQHRHGEHHSLRAAQ